MILPDKYIEEKNTLLYVGALILDALNTQYAISELWNQFRDNPSVGTYERFILALDMLFIFGLIELKENKIKKV